MPDKKQQNRVEPAADSLFSKRHRDIFEQKNLKVFFVPLVGFVAHQFSTGLPFVITSVLIGSLGDTLSLAIFGLGRTFTALFFVSIINGITETMGVLCSKLFTRKDYFEIGCVFWKTIISVLGLIAINALVSFNSYKILVALRIDDQLAYFTSQFLISSIPYLLLQGINNVFVAFLASQSLSQAFVYINSASIAIVAVAGKYIIIDLQCKHMGFIYAKAIQELINFVIYLIIILRKAKKETLIFPNPFAVLRGYWSYFVALVKTVMCFYGESVGLQISAYYAALLHDINELAVYCSYISFSIMGVLIAAGVAGCFRTTIGHLIGQKKFVKARTTAQQFYVYTFLICILITLLSLSFKYELGYLFTGDPLLANSMARTLSIFGFLVYAMLNYGATISLYRLLGLNDFLLRTSLILYPLLVTTIGYACCFIMGLRVKGIIIGIATARIITFVYLIHRLFSRIDWAQPESSAPLQQKMLPG